MKLTRSARIQGTVTDLVAKYEKLDLERMLSDVAGLEAGRMIPYQGK